MTDKVPEFVVALSEYLKREYNCKAPLYWKPGESGEPEVWLEISGEDATKYLEEVGKFIKAVWNVMDNLGAKFHDYHVLESTVYDNAGLRSQVGEAQKIM
ncbi:MAG: hypothetical protein HYU86_06565 [Chloroflexi bacterium]|nr:hypothetical protein [Chloroflexota bacterium]